MSTILHYEEFIEHDMAAVRVSSDHRLAIVGSAGYFGSHRRQVDAGSAASRTP